MAAGLRGRLDQPQAAVWHHVTARNYNSRHAFKAAFLFLGFWFRLPSAAAPSGRSRRTHEWLLSLVPVMLSAGVRRFATSAIRRSHYEEGPGKNLPFSVDNKWRLLAMMCVFFGSGFGAPFFIVRHQLLKK